MAQTIRLHRAGKIVVKPGAMTPGWIREPREPAVYLAIILGRVASTPVADVSYATVLLWTAGAAAAA